jgi:hypothetical protein
MTDSVAKNVLDKQDTLPTLETREIATTTKIKWQR